MMQYSKDGSGECTGEPGGSGESGTDDVAIGKMQSEPKNTRKHALTCYLPYLSYLSHLSYLSYLYYL